MTEDMASEFGNRLRELREAAGLTQRQLAEQAGLHLQGVVKLERGEREPAWSTLLALAKALGVSVAAFAEKATTQATKRSRGRPPKVAASTPRTGVREAEAKAKKTRQRNGS
jgi:transcriptional regulator with XRE-family HTH domain